MHWFRIIVPLFRFPTADSHEPLSPCTLAEIQQLSSKSNILNPADIFSSLLVQKNFDQNLEVSPMRIAQTHSTTRIVFTLFSISMALLVAGSSTTKPTNAGIESPAGVRPFELIIQGASPTPTPCCSDDNKPHTLVGSYYSLENNFSTTLLLKSLVFKWLTRVATRLVW